MTSLCVFAVSCSVEFRDKILLSIYVTLRRAVLSFNLTSP